MKFAGKVVLQKKFLGLLYEVFSEIILTEKNVINDGFSD